MQGPPRSGRTAGNQEVSGRVRRPQRLGGTAIKRLEAIAEEMLHTLLETEHRSGRRLLWVSPHMRGWTLEPTHIRRWSALGLMIRPDSGYEKRRRYFLEMLFKRLAEPIWLGSRDCDGGRGWCLRRRCVDRQIRHGCGRQADGSPLIERRG